MHMTWLEPAAGLMSDEKGIDTWRPTNLRNGYSCEHKLVDEAAVEVRIRRNTIKDGRGNGRANLPVAIGERNDTLAQ